MSIIFALRLKTAPKTRRVSNPNSKALKRLYIEIFLGCLLFAYKEKKVVIVVV